MLINICRTLHTEKGTNVVTPSHLLGKIVNTRNVESDINFFMLHRSWHAKNSLKKESVLDYITNDTQHMVNLQRIHTAKKYNSINNATSASFQRPGRKTRQKCVSKRYREAMRTGVLVLAIMRTEAARKMITITMSESSPSGALSGLLKLGLQEFVECVSGGRDLRQLWVREIVTVEQQRSRA